MPKKQEYEVISRDAKSLYNSVFWATSPRQARNLAKQQYPSHTIIAVTEIPNPKRR